MDTHDDEPTTERPLMFDWAAHRRTMLLAALVSLSALLLVYLLRTGTVREAMVQAVRVQLILMSVVIPAAAVGGRTRMEVLCRGGTVNDAFGVGLLVVTWVTSEFTIPEALKLYLLVSTAGLICLGVFWWVREATGRATAGSLAAGALGLSLWAGMFEATGAGFNADAPLSAGQWILANADLHGAVTGSLGLAESPSPWYGVLLVYVAVAGMVWSGPLLSAHDADERPEPEQRSDGNEEE